MCTCPILIPNKLKTRSKFGRAMLSNNQYINGIKDIESEYLRVPCNHCSECLKRRQLEITQRCQNELLDHYCFFGTLTYSPEAIPHFVTSDGSDITFANCRDFSLMVKRIRKNNLLPRPFHYILVSERGTTKGRPHFHYLMFVPKYDSDSDYTPVELEKLIYCVVFNEWRRNVGSTRNPVWQPLFHYHEKFVAGKKICNFDLHYVTSHSSDKGADDVSFYVSKYIFKPSKFERLLYSRLRASLDPIEFFRTWSVVKSRSVFSKRVGYHSDKQKSKIQYCINTSSSNKNGFQFFQSDGKPVPLARYYRRYASLDALRSSVIARGGPISLYDIPSVADHYNSEQSSLRVRHFIESKDISDLITD